MGYSETRLGAGLLPDAAGLAPIAFQTAADKSTWTALGPVTILRVGFLVTTAVTVTPAVVAFDKRVTYASDVGRGTGDGGIVTVPVGAAIGKHIYKDVTLDMNPGNQLVAELTGASTAGAGIAIVEYVPRSEMPANYGGAASV